MTNEELEDKIAALEESDRLMDMVILMELLDRINKLEDRVTEVEGPPIKLGKRT